MINYDDRWQIQVQCQTVEILEKFSFLLPKSSLFFSYYTFFCFFSCVQLDMLIAKQMPKSTRWRATLRLFDFPSLSRSVFCCSSGWPLLQSLCVSALSPNGSANEYCVPAGRRCYDRCVKHIGNKCDDCSVFVSFLCDNTLATGRADSLLFTEDDAGGPFEPSWCLQFSFIFAFLVPLISCCCCRYQSIEVM